MKYFAMIVSVFAGVLLLAGCSSIKDLNVALGQQAANGDEVSFAGLNILKNKTTKKEVANAIGAPALVFKNNIGGDSWVYSRVAVRRNSVGIQAKANLAAIFPYQAHSLSHGGGIAGVGGSGNIQADNSSYKTAGLVVKFNKDGCVHSYEFTATSF